MTDQDNANQADGTPAEQPDIQGEGNYDASRRFDADQKAYVDKNKEAIPGLAEDAADALDGPEGDELRKAEAEGRSHAAE